MARKRRGRGEGSIYQRGDGLWTASVNLGYGPDGRRKRRTIYGATKAEAQAKLQQVLGDAGRGVDVSPQKLTVGQWLDRWLALIKPTVEPNTYGPYERHVRLHLAPHIGPVPLRKLAVMHIKGLYSTLAAAGMSAALQRKVGTTLTIALNQAVEAELVAGNAATKLRKPKAQKSEIVVLDSAKVNAFLRAAAADRLYPCYLAALDSGARPGELFALTWNDVDFDGGFLSITKSLEDINGRLRVKDVKTKKGRRRVDLSAGTVAALAEHRKAALAAGRMGSPVFHDTDGGHLRISNVHRNSFKPALKRAGLPDVPLYSLRHSCATLLLLAGVPAKVVSERLGHATVTLTLDTYSHVLPSMQRRAADTIGAFLGAAPAPAAVPG